MDEMLTPAKPDHSNRIKPRYPAAFGVSAAFWACIILAFTCFIDPYGVSPLHVTITGVNVLKPKRLDIDRLIKPFEVWHYRPRTLFLGTSRIHQSIDPALFDGSRFAPAYNASIPNESLEMSLADFRQHMKLDRKLRTVFVELFIYNFFGQGRQLTEKPWTEFIGNTATLLASDDAFWDSLATIDQNAVVKQQTYEIKPGGYFYYPPGHQAGGPFSGFAAAVWQYQPKSGKLRLNDATFDTVHDFVAAARANDIELVFLATPNHAYFDYYIDAIGAWDIVEEWLRRLSEIATVYSFSQPNAWVYEPVRNTMKYWNDPYHFSLAMGRGIAASLIGRSSPNLPDDFMVRLTPANVATHIESRRAAIKVWARDNPAFVAQLERERIGYAASLGNSAQN